MLAFSSPPPSKAIKLDFRHFEDGYVVKPSDIEEELKRIGHKLSPLDIVVVNTRAGERYGKEDYVASGCGMGREVRGGKVLLFCN